MHEMARVLAPGGRLVFTDFHPDAARAGMTRSFTDGDKRKHELLHGLYSLADHQAAAAKVGLVLEQARELRVGRELSETFTGSDAFYQHWQGLAVVLAVRMRKA